MSYTASHSIMTFGKELVEIKALLGVTAKSCDAIEDRTIDFFDTEDGVRIDISANADTIDVAESKVSQAIKNARDLLGESIYGIDVKGIEFVCVDLLKVKKLTLATAESCTGGQIAARLTSIPGVSAAYRGGVVSYWTSVKNSVLGVPNATLEQFGAVSEETARYMAEGARKITGSEIGVSVTGVAGPDPDERGIRVGIVYVGLSTPTGTFCRSCDFGFLQRSQIQRLSANNAFDMIRCYISGFSV